jgi:predicted house-cleaning noncanonical NTP pyrophosphatase (MazG superfamily)
MKLSLLFGIVPNRDAFLQRKIMQRRKFKQEKLWRDKAIDRLEQMGSKVHWTKLDAEQFLQQLKRKLLEEAEEVWNAKTEEHLVEELADVLEVVEAFCELHGKALQDVIALQHKKREERGGFQGRRFVTVAEHPIGSFGEKYCLNDPEKYPEIID